MPYKNYDNTTVGRYIRAIENPDSIGFDKENNDCMRKLGIVLAGILLFTAVCCRHEESKVHVFSTYYGDIDIDSMEASFTRDGHDWYLVHQCDEDSFNWDGEWKYLKGPILDFYCPDLDIYEEESPDNQGRRIVTEIDPYTMYNWLNN